MEAPVQRFAAYIGGLSAVASGAADGKTGNALAVLALQQTAQQYVQRVYGLGAEAATRLITLIDIAGGWQAVVDRTEQKIETANK